MDATPRNPGRQGTSDDRRAAPLAPGSAGGSAGATSLKWSALHEAAATVGRLAGLTGEPVRPEVRNFPVHLAEAGGWRRTLAEQGIDDLVAIMEPGLAALLAAHGRGGNPVVAAGALWHEFIAARDAVLAIAVPVEP